jgi:hypothetical protein
MSWSDQWYREARWECVQRGRHCCRGCGHRDVRSKEAKWRVRWCWVGGKSCSQTSGSIVESFICKAVEVEPLHSLEPTLEVIVLRSIGARLSDFVLGNGVKTSVKLQDDCNGIHIARECDDVRATLLT